MAMRRWSELVLVTATYYPLDMEQDIDPDLYDAYIPGSLAAGRGPIAFEVSALALGSSRGIDGYSLVADIADGEGRKEFYAQDINTFETICNRLRRPDDMSVGVLTVWDCEAGTNYIPGEPDEYEDDAQLVGYLHPETFEVVQLA